MTVTLKLLPGTCHRRSNGAADEPREAETRSVDGSDGSIRALARGDPVPRPEWGTCAPKGYIRDP